MFEIKRSIVRMSIMTITVFIIWDFESVVEVSSTEGHTKAKRTQ